MGEKQAVSAEFLPGLYAELDRAMRCEMTWVMDLDWYKRIRRHAAAVRPRGEPEDDEDKWAPSIDDRLLALRMLVRDDGGEPHIEWMTREEIGLPGSRDAPEVPSGATNRTLSLVNMLRDQLIGN